MGIYAIKPLFQKSLKPLFNLFIRFKVHPDTINFLALLTSVLTGIALLYADKFKLLFIAVPILVLLRTAFNALDGMVARELKISSSIGEVYNELYDRLSDIAIFILLSFATFADQTLKVFELPEQTDALAD